MIRFTRSCVVAFSLTILLGYTTSFAQSPNCASTTGPDTEICKFSAIPIGHAPIDRDYAAAAYCESTGEMVMFGGDSITNVAQTWITNEVNWRRLYTDPASTPSTRSNHAMVSDPANDRLIMHGGYDNGQTLGDTWEFLCQEREWHQLTTVADFPRSGHVLISHTGQGKIFLIGGLISPGSVGSGLFVLDEAAGSWISFGSVPQSNRFYHAGVYDSVRDRILYCGGYTYQGNPPVPVLLSTCYQVEILSTPQPSVMASIAPTAGHVMAFDEYRGVTVIHGGTSGYPMTDYHATTNTWNIAQNLNFPEPNQENHVMVYSPKSRSMLLVTDHTSGFNGKVHLWRYGASYRCDNGKTDQGSGIQLFGANCADMTPTARSVDPVYGQTVVGYQPILNPDTGEAYADERYFLSSSGRTLGELVSYDELHASGSPLLDSFQDQPSQPVDDEGMPLDPDGTLPIELWVQPKTVNDPQLDVTGLIVNSGGAPLTYELMDPDGAPGYFGNSPIYLVRNCSLIVDDDNGHLVNFNWLSQYNLTDPNNPDLFFISGLLSELRQDGDFSRVCSFDGGDGNKPRFDDRENPPPGDAYYYLVNGGDSGDPDCPQLEFGHSSLSPDVRASISLVGISECEQSRGPCQTQSNGLVPCLTRSECESTDGNAIYNGDYLGHDPSCSSP